MSEIPVSNIAGYMVAFVFIAIMFGIVRIIVSPPWRKRETAPISLSAPSVAIPTAPSISLDIIAAAVAGAHTYLRNKKLPVLTPKISQTAPHRQLFINYWTVSERLNPFYKEDPFHREKSQW